MKIWRRTTGAVKDKLSLITTAAADEKFTAAIIKATSHDDLSIDIQNVQVIHRYINKNPLCFKAILRAITLRVERTRSWTVALKCLMLLHGLFLAGSTDVESIGRLPFDLSDFGKRKSRFSRTGRFNVFVRAYFLFLDRRSILFFNDNEKSNEITIRLEIFVKMQRIIDSLMRIRPVGEAPLVIEGMEYVISEILEIYGQIGREFADLSSGVNGNSEAELAVKIVAKSLSHEEEVLNYFEFCRDFGVTKAREIPSFLRIPESQVIVVVDKLLHVAPEIERTAKITPVTGRIWRRGIGGKK